MENDLTKQKNKRRTFPWRWYTLSTASLAISHVKSLYQSPALHSTILQLLYHESMTRQPNIPSIALKPSLMKICLYWNGEIHHHIIWACRLLIFYMEDALVPVICSRRITEAWASGTRWSASRSFQYHSETEELDKVLHWLNCTIQSLSHL